MNTSDELRAARTAQLSAASAERSAAKRADVQRALMKLRSRGGPFDLATVARFAGCSTSYLRKHPDIAAEIRALEGSAPRRTANEGSPAASSAASLQTKLSVATERLRRLEAENSRLRAENASLRGDLVDLQRKSRRHAPGRARDRSGLNDAGSNPD